MNNTGEFSSWGDLPPEARAEIERLIPEGKRIEAIKVYRRHTDGTLKEAKDAVDSAASGMGIEFRDGCSPGLSCWVIVLAFLAWMGFIASMPFLAKFVLREIYGDSLSHGLTETIQALSAIVMVLISVVLFIVWTSRRTGRRGEGGEFPEEDGR